MGKTVKIYDFKTKLISDIPAAELSSTMVEADVQGVGRVWIDATTLKKSEYRHPPFPENIRDFFRQIKASLDEVYPRTVEQWEDGFRRDSNPAQEIAIWLRVAEIYQQCIVEKNLSHLEREDYLGVILACTRSPREHVFEIYQPKVISRLEAENAIDLFFKEG